MKKLWGGIFRQQQQQQQQAQQQLSPTKRQSIPSAPSTSTTSSDSFTNDHNQKTPPRTGADTTTPGSSYKTGPRSSWESFFSSAATRVPVLTAIKAAPSTAKTSTNVFNQNLDILMREIAAQIKVMLQKMDPNANVDEELRQLGGFINLAADKLQQSDEQPLFALTCYFASPAGMLLCEQTALLSLVLDFIDRVRIYLVKNELHDLMVSSTPASSPVKTKTTMDLERPLILLMNCVQAIASNPALMEAFRCELPNLIQLTAEEYPPTGMFLRDLSSQALSSIPDKNFNAALVWYLHDCNIIAKTVRLMSSYSFATPTSQENAARALQLYLDAHMISSPSVEQTSGTDPIAAAAAVGNALGLNKGVKDFSMSPIASQASEGTAANEERGVISPSSPSEDFCLPCYDVLVGLKSIVYVLQKTCRYSMVLLGEFQSSGGYTLLSSLLQTCLEEDMPTVIYLFTLLLPLGTGFSGAWGGDESMATIINCGARNVNAFTAMRDVLLSCISDLELMKDDNELTSAAKLRHEQLILQLLTTVLHVYTSDYDNFLCLEPKTQMLALALTKLPWIAYYDAKIIVLRIVEYVCAAAKADAALPMDILHILCSLFIEYSALETQDVIMISCIDVASESFEQESTGLSMAKRSDPKSTVPSVDVVNVDSCENQGIPTSPAAPSASLSPMLGDCIIKILQDATNVRYRDELYSFGLLERGVYAFFIKIANSLLTCSASDAHKKHQYLSNLHRHLDIWSCMASIMLKDNVCASVEFRELQIHHSLHVIGSELISADILKKSTKTQRGRNCVSSFSVLAILVELSNFKIDESSNVNDNIQLEDYKSSLNTLQRGVESDLSKILEWLQVFRGFSERQYLLVDILKCMLNGKAFVREPWRMCQGYEKLISILSSLGDTNNESAGLSFQMMDSILEIISIMLDPTTGDDINRNYFKAEVGYPAIASCLINSGVLESDTVLDILNRVFEMITGHSLPRTKIRNGDAAQILFLLLPKLQNEIAVSSLNRLLMKLMSNDDFTFSKKKQTAILVQAGIFKWMADPSIASLFTQNENELREPLFTLIVELSKEELSTSDLRDFLNVVAKGMPLLLGNQYDVCSCNGNEASNADGEKEIGLHLLEQAFERSTVPHISVGTHVKSRMAAGYAHVVNNVDRTWPPSSGYSFACWLRISRPTESSQAVPNATILDRTSETNGPAGQGSTVCVALCEGYLIVNLDGDDTENKATYCVLVGALLSIYPSSECAIKNENVINTLDITAVARYKLLEFNFWSHEKRYLAKCNTSDEVEMWLRAMQQSESISNLTTRNKIAAGELLSSEKEVLFVTEDPSASTSTVSNDELEGFVCIMSVYSVESAGCFVRVYFDHATGALRIDTGSVSSGPNMNPSSKRMSAVFKNVDISLFQHPSRYSHKSPRENVACEEEDGDFLWHHVAFTHRKAVVGNSLLTLYIDGSEVTTKKLSFPSAPATGTMHAFVGKDIQVCGTYAALPWSIGPTWFTEELLTANAIACMFLLGPSFSGQFSGYAYRSVGDWPEALAAAYLDRSSQRRVDIVRLAKRLHLTALAVAGRRQWNDGAGAGSGMGSGVTNHDSPSMSDNGPSNRDDFMDGFRFTGGGSSGMSRKEWSNFAAFQRFIKDNCSMSTLGNEIMQLLSGFKLSEDLLLFSLNTNCTLQSKATTLSHTQVHYIGSERSRPLNLAKLLPSVGGVTQVLFPLLDNAWKSVELNVLLRLLALTMRRNPSCLTECLEKNGYALLASMLCSRMQCVDENVLASIIGLAIAGSLESHANLNQQNVSDRYSLASPLVVDSMALSQLVLCIELREKLPRNLQCQLILYLQDIVAPSNRNSLFNARQMRRAGILTWILMYLSDLCNEECSMDQIAAMEHRWCYPNFFEACLNELLQRLLALLRTFLHVENCMDDIFIFADILLLSITNDSVHNQGSPIRVVLLQFLLHELEKDAECGQALGLTSTDDSELIGATLVSAILNRDGKLGQSKKRKDRQPDNSSSVTSPLGGISSGPVSSVSTISIDGIDNILLEVIHRKENGPFARVEALLAFRILLSLAQDHPSFAQHFFQTSPTLIHKLKRVLKPYSTDCNMYIPLLAYVSNIPIKDTKYHDPVTSSSEQQQYALPTPSGFAAPEKYCVDQVWGVLGTLLLCNCEHQEELAKQMNAIIFAQLTLQAEVCEAFFTTICNSSSTVIAIVIQCILRQAEASHKSAERVGVEHQQDSTTLEYVFTLQESLAYLLSGRKTESFQGAMAIVYLDLLRVLVTRSLFEKDEFAAMAMYMLECLDDGITHQHQEKIFSLADGQKCWLALVVHAVKSTKALSENCSFVALKNICTLTLALSRYLVEEIKHQGAVNDTEFSSESSSQQLSSSPEVDHGGSDSRTESISRKFGAPGSCFGTDVLVFFISSIRMCSEQHTMHVVGADDQHFFYGILVYCAQTVVLKELNGVHKGVTPQQRLVECLVNFKHLLVQQTKCSSVIVCGIPSNHHINETSGTVSSGTTPTGGFSGHLLRMRSLSAHTHKEFGIGAESDRSFILSLAAELFRMLVDDSESVRYASILIWQFLINHRMGVLKELLIVEPRATLLQNITSNKKEVIDVFHGGFDRLLHVFPHPPDRVGTGSSFTSNEPTESTNGAGSDSTTGHENWLQFHIWLTENFDLLKDLILGRTEPIYQHLIDVLLSCISVRKVSINTGMSRHSGQNEVCINVDFALFFDKENADKSFSTGPVADEALESRYKFAARKTLIRLVNIRESALDAMNESHQWWCETALRLVHTRSIWQMGGWQTSLGKTAGKIDQLRSGCAESAEPFYVERSIFQINSFKYQLDFTEGPQRLRLRLVRAYAINDDDSDSVQSTSGQMQAKEPQHIAVSPETKFKTEDPFKKIREFHEAVEVFREYLSKQSTIATVENSSSHEKNQALIKEIIAQCRYDKTRETFLPHDQDQEALQPVALARRLLNMHLESFDHDTAAVGGMHVSELILTDIRNIIIDAEEHPDTQLLPTLFDAADLELIQRTISTATTPSATFTELPDAVETDTAVAPVTVDSDDEIEVTVAALPSPDLADEDFNDQERDDDGEQDADAKQANEAIDETKSDFVVQEHITPTASRQFDYQNATSDIQDETVAEKSGMDQQEKVFDSSVDYMFGGMARFFHRDDYPPIRCYNAVYIAGMAKITGIFLLCRESLNFVSGYGKVYNFTEGDSGGAAGVAALFANAMNPSGPSNTQSNPLSPGKPVNGIDKPAGVHGKKKAKDVIRNTLADFSTQFLKSASSQLYTIVPIVDHHDTTSSPSPVSADQAPSLASKISSSKRWSIKYSNVKQFWRIKYQLRPVGIEFFDTFGSTFFLQFESESEREEVIRFIFQMPIVNSIFWNPVLRSSALSLSIKRIRQALTKRWTKGIISNFEYLMHLNTLAGRSFNDLTQYPVFPWVVADYKSEFLDLDDPETFRDLSKPMGALSESRAAQFRERYNAMRDMGQGPMNSPAFHYGTHYSCSAYVVNYLIRLEPYTKLALELQGGYFDHADRLFRSIPASWDSASVDNLQDVRELIPEFYYLPEFLYNANHYDFGTTQSGEVVSHVNLPPWAHGDPREFIRLHRRALESKYVSENLHHWIDLIFGVKQTGQAALDAQNVFMHITYEGTVDIDQIEDPVMRNAMLAQIEHFGQTPSRIFASAHPPRKVPTLLSTTPSSAAAAGHQYEGNTLSSVEAYVKWHTPLAPALVSIGKDYVFLKKQSMAKVLDDAAVGDVRLVNEKFHCRPVGFSFVPPRYMKYVDWGSTEDGTIKFRVHQISARYREANKVISVIEGAHLARVNCAMFSDDGAILVTGGQDAVVNVIECVKVSGQRVFKQLAKLVGHEDAVLAVAINKEFNLIASGSADCCVILWDLRTRIFLRELQGHTGPVCRVAINSSNGNILTATTSEIRIWSINGDLLAATSIQAVGMSEITCGISTRCDTWQNGVVAITGHSNGTIALWGLSYPSDIHKEKQLRFETDLETTLSPIGERSQGRSNPSSNSSSTNDFNKITAVRISGSNPSLSHTAGKDGGDTQPSGELEKSSVVVRAVPSCQLFIMKLLLDHRASVTALTLWGDQRQLLSGDADGNCIRWIDDSISTNSL